MLYISATGFLDADRGSVGIQKKDGYQKQHVRVSSSALSSAKLISIFFPRSDKQTAESRNLTLRAREKCAFGVL